MLSMYLLTIPSKEACNSWGERPTAALFNGDCMHYNCYQLTAYPRGQATTTHTHTGDKIHRMRKKKSLHFLDAFRSVVYKHTIL